MNQERMMYESTTCMLSVLFQLCKFKINRFNIAYQDQLSFCNQKELQMIMNQGNNDMVKGLRRLPVISFLSHTVHENHFKISSLVSCLDFRTLTLLKDFTVKTPFNLWFRIHLKPF